MQADRIQVLAQQAAAGNVDAFIALVQEFAPDLRLMLAAHLDQPTALAAVESAVWTAVRSRLGEFIGDPLFATWIQSVAIEPLTTHLTQADRRAVDIQDALAHQNIQACHEALADGRELQVAQLRHRIAALPETMRALLMRRYRDRQRPSDIAANLMISESELAISLATARSLCDWRELARPPAAGDRLLPPLIEDWLNQTIDVDSRALLATNLGRDHDRAAQFARQVRVHVALGACLAPFTREDAASLVRQSGLGAGDSGRVMMGDGARPSATARPAGSEARRPARMATSNRQVVPLTDDAPRPSPMPWIIGGGMVLVGIFALVAMSLRTGTTKVAPPRPVAPEPTIAAPAPAAAPTSVTPPPPDRSAPGAGGVLRVDPGRTTVPPPPPRITLSGQVITGRGYIGHPLELRADLSHTYGVTAVEVWNATERVATFTKEPYVWYWDKPVAGTASFTVRAIGAAGTLSTSAPAPVTITPGYGTGTVMREWWSGVGGDQIAQGVTVSGYPDRPQSQESVSRFVSRDRGDGYLERLRGFIVPPVDGEYVFWIAGDDECELWLSEDDTRARLRRIAASPCVSPEEWERHPSQRSAPIVLTHGRRYYVEALHKEGGGDDHLSVSWRLPDGTLERPIPGAHLSPPTEPVPAGAVVVTAPPVVSIPAAQSMLVLWNGDNVAGGSGYASTGITKVAGSGRDGSTGLQVQLTQGFANLGWNWFSWAPDDAGSDLRTHKAISFWMRIEGANRPTSASLQFLSSPKSIQARSASIDLAALVPQFADGQWHEVVIPLDRLTAPGFDPAKVWEFNLKLQGRGTLASTVSFDDFTALPQLPVTAPTTAPALSAAANSSNEARRPDMMIWDGEGASGGAGYKGIGNSVQSFDHKSEHGRSGATLRAHLGGGNAANVGWNWHAWSYDGAGTDLSGFTALSMWVRFTGPAAPQQVVMRLLCSPREPVRRTVDVNLSDRQPGLMDGAWHQVIVPFKDLLPAGHNFDLTKVWEIAFDLSSAVTLDGIFDVDEIGALRSLIPPTPPPAAVLVWKPVRAINLGGETTDVDGVRMFGHRQAEADGASSATSHQPGPWLSELNWIRGTTGAGEIRRNRSMEEKPLTIDGKVYAKGLGVHANSELVFALDGRQSGFTAIVGVDDEAPAGELIFQVWLDGQKVWDSGVMRKGMAKPVAVPLTGRKELRLVVDSNGPGEWDHADWANAQFLVPGGDDGALQVQLGRRATATFTPKPAVDAKTRALLSTALVGTKEGLAFRVKVPNGPSRVWLWVAENGTANSRQFDLTIEGTTLAGIGSLPANGWEKLGPIDVNVADGTIDIAATVLKGIPQVMGMLVEQPASAP